MQRTFRRGGYSRGKAVLFFNSGLTSRTEELKRFYVRLKLCVSYRLLCVYGKTGSVGVGGRRGVCRLGACGVTRCADASCASGSVTVLKSFGGLLFGGCFGLGTGVCIIYMGKELRVGVGARGCTVCPNRVLVYVPGVVLDGYAADSSFGNTVFYLSARVARGCLRGDDSV